MAAASAAVMRCRRRDDRRSPRAAEADGETEGEITGKEELSSHPPASAIVRTSNRPGRIRWQRCGHYSSGKKLANSPDLWCRIAGNREPHHASPSHWGLRSVLSNWVLVLYSSYAPSLEALAVRSSNAAMCCSSSGLNVRAAESA